MKFCFNGLEVDPFTKLDPNILKKKESCAQKIEAYPFIGLPKSLYRWNKIDLSCNGSTKTGTKWNFIRKNYSFH